MSYPKVLFIETGNAGGGSFESLLQHLKAIQNRNTRHCVLFFNKPPIIMKYEELNLNLYFHHSFLISRNANTAITKILKKWLRLVEFSGSSILKFHLEKVFYRKTLSFIKQIIVTNNINIIHTNTNPYNDLFAILSAKQNSLPVVSHIRDLPRFRISKSKIKLLNQYAIKFIANSSSVSKAWSKIGINKNNIVVVYNGIDYSETDTFRNKAQKFNEFKILKPIICVGRLISWKGHSFLLDAIQILSTYRNDFILKIVGNGPQLTNLKNQAKTLGISRFTEFVGYRSDARTIIASSYCLVLPSKEEAFGRVLIEAMDSGTPCIATKSGGPSEIIEHGKTGFLVDYGDSINLANMINLLLSDFSLRMKIANFAKTRVKQNFSIQTYVCRIDSIYRELLKNYINLNLSV